MIWILVISLIINLWLAVTYFRTRTKHAKIENLQAILARTEHERSQAIETCAILTSELTKLSLAHLELKQKIVAKAAESKTK